MKKILSLIVLMLGFAFFINADSYKVSFLPSDGMSSYTVKHTDGSGVAYTVGVDDKQALEVDITREGLAYIELSLEGTEKTINDKEYVFFGWLNTETGEHLSYNANYTGVFASAMTIKPDFIPKEWAHYVIKNNQSVKYYDLNKAIAKAQTGSGDGKIVVVDKNGVLPKGDYTIPSGVTLLVPGDGSYTCKDVLGKDDLVNENQTSSVYRTWTIESGTNITVNGTVCIYSKLICYSGVVFGRPYQYGHVIMQDDTKMTLESGAKLSAFGYITGSLQSSIEAKSGAVVYECFQIRDWRGGNASADMILENYNTLDLGMARLINAASLAGLGDGKPNYYGVFPFSHYYIQNIETPLLIRKGADERLVTGVDVGLGLTFVDIAFIGQQGLFALGDNSYFTKYYDVNTDRVKFAIKGETESATASFGTISLPAKLTDDLVLEICSKDYTLPIAHNIDIMLENVDITIQDNFALLAGSTLFVDKNSKVVVNGGGSDYTRWTQVKEYLISAKLITETIKKTSSIYIYDKEWNNGYFGMYNASLLTVGARPEGMQFTRTSVEDAKVVVDGTIELSQYGFVYTTKGENCGANITSNGGGSIKYGTLGSATKTLQVTQSETNITYVDIPVDNAKLRNADGTYETPTANTTYYYCDGTWGSSNCEKVSDPVDYTPIFTASIDEITAYMEEESGTGILNITSGNQLVTNPAYTYSITGRDARMFNYEPAAKIVTFTPASVGEKTATLILTAAYSNNGKEYKHTEAITLIGKALNYAENTLAFNDLSTIYVGKQNISLFKNRNNENDITITIGDNNEEISIPNASGIFNALKEGEVTITLSQDADEENNIAATTISTTLTINPRVVWNWGTLYYPSVNENPVSVLDGSTGWALTEIIDPKSGDVVNFIGTSPETYEAEIFDLINGEYSVQFKFKQGNEEIVFNSEIYRDPRIVRVNVNEERTYQAVTVGDTEGVSYNDGIVSIVSGSQTNSWTIHFLGVPDKLYFIPTGEKAWLIEESRDGLGWETTFSWAYLAEGDQFEHSLKPSTQYVRVSYAANGTGTLRDVYITKLEGVKLNPNKLYMPAEAGAEKTFMLTYVSDTEVVISDPNGMFTATPSELQASTTDPYYKEVSVEVKNNSCTEERLVNMNIASSLGSVQLPIQAYAAQKLPIVLAADHKERFYYIASEAVNATWNEDARTITMHNTLKEIPNVSPSVTFSYEGYPSYISFMHIDGIKGEWKIEEYKGGKWTALTANREVTSTNGSTKKTIKQPVSNDAQSLRVTYVSLYAEKVDIEDLMIIGEAGAFATPTELQVKYESVEKNSSEFSVTAINLVDGMTISVDNSNFKLSHGNAEATDQPITLTSGSGGYADVFAENVMKAINFKAYFNGTKAVDYATITVTKGSSTSDVLATIKVVGICKFLNNGDIKICTGVPDGTDGTGNNIEGATKYTLSGFDGSGYRSVDINDAFSDGKAYFDYLFVFGETTTMDGTTTITKPTTIAGSNAKTPCYIYEKNGDVYQFKDIVENANASTKITQNFLQLTGEGKETLKVYITGFCPYASTGYTKQDEGVFFFQGGAGDDVHVYLEDCCLYSRSKTEDGHYFEGRSDGQSFTEGYVRGSGGVLVFECSNSSNQKNQFNVTIHTRGKNILKSHYGCFLESVAGRAYQVSSPVQIHMKDENFVEGSYTILSFDDIWFEEHTNGFLSLQKQVNNAPSIDMGNDKTVVNFNGGQIELQNAQNVSDNYTTTLAISHRIGTFAGFRLAWGLGSDGVGGRVNFNDGTTTVLRMKVDERYRQYYLMDENDLSTSENEADFTSCLRCPKKTFVYGGSHCMMRACSEPTSKGGAPTNGDVEITMNEDDVIETITGDPLGLYQYPRVPAEGHKGGWEKGNNGLVNPTAAPSDYGISSVTPNNNGTEEEDDDYLNFWVPAGYDDSVEPEIDQKISFWKACMTEIAASYGGYGGQIGGATRISMDNDGKQTEVVSNLLYCTIDKNIRDVISGVDAPYSAPVKSPLPSGDEYLYVTPSSVGDSLQHHILNAGKYQVENKVYYITPATADNWMTFTAPFNVANVYIMETYNESYFDEMNCSTTEVRGELLKYQAKYNAHFAAFFGVAMAIHPNKTFDMIYNEYIGWAETQNIDAGKWELVPYTGSNWSGANCYMYHNTDNWELEWEQVEGEDEETFVEPVYTPKWEYLTINESQPMMEKGQTYSILLPYCVGCNDGTEWDYWTGKFLIFESTVGPHTIEGSDYVGNSDPSEDDDNWVFEKYPTLSTEAALTGNSTFAKMQTTDTRLFYYDQTMGNESFLVNESEEEQTIEPTGSFLLADPSSAIGTQVFSISRMGKIKYRTGDNNGDDTPTGGEHVPTVGGGSDIFVTSVAEGINISVSEPQYVGVFSATGALLYNGWVETSVDVNLVVNGVYVVVGENNSVKVIY